MRKHEKHEANRVQRKMHYNAADNNGKLIINLRDISHTMRFLYEGKGSQKRILIVLYEVGTITQRALTERLGIQPGSASEVIAKLENAGLVVRTSSESDRRTANISLTKEGEILAIEATEQRNKRHEEMFSSLSESEKTQLLFLLEKINSDWEKRYQDIEEREELAGSRHKFHGDCHHGSHDHGRVQHSEQGE